MGGVLGRLFREFAVTICASILISGIVSITLTPMMCSRFLRSSHEQPADPGSTASPKASSTGMLRIYDRALLWVLAPPPRDAGQLLRRAGRDGWPVRHHPEGLRARAGHRSARRSPRKPSQGTAFQQMAEYQKQVAEIVNADPDVDSLVGDRGRPYRVRAWAARTSARSSST